MFLEDKNKFSSPNSDPWSLEALIAWLETKHADGVYDYCDGRNCLMAQYFRHAGIKFSSISACNTYVEENVTGMDVMKYYPENFWLIARPQAGQSSHQTYGSALARARSLFAKEMADT